MSRDTEGTDFDPRRSWRAGSTARTTIAPVSMEELEMSRDTEIDFKPQNYHVQKSSHPYEPKFARWTEKFRLVGAEWAELEDFFAVDTLTMEAWAREHLEFAQALDTQPTALGVSSEDIGLFNWLISHRRGDLG